MQNGVHSVQGFCVVGCLLQPIGAHSGDLDFCFILTFTLSFVFLFTATMLHSNKHKFSEFVFIAKSFTKSDHSKSFNVACFVFRRVFSGCYRGCHLFHPAADWPYHCCHSGLLQAQEESSEKWKRRIATP